MTAVTTVSHARVKSYAELVVGLGAAVSQGQQVLIDAHVEHREFVRALAAAAYERRAAHVDAVISDKFVQLTRLEGVISRSATPRLREAIGSTISPRRIRSPSA